MHLIFAVPPALVFGMMAASAAVSLIYMLYTGQDPDLKHLDVQTWQTIEQSIEVTEPPNPLDSVQAP